MVPQSQLFHWKSIVWKKIFWNDQMVGKQKYSTRVVIVISILLKYTFLKISFYSKSLVKILWRSDKDKISFKAIEKYRYGLWKTLSKQLLLVYQTKLSMHSIVLFSVWSDDRLVRESRVNAFYLCICIHIM